VNWRTKLRLPSLGSLAEDPIYSCGSGREESAVLWYEVTATLRCLRTFEESQSQADQSADSSAEAKLTNQSLTSAVDGRTDSLQCVLQLMVLRAGACDCSLSGSV
jgi:hypothetical protein